MSKAFRIESTNSSPERFLRLSYSRLMTESFVVRSASHPMPVPRNPNLSSFKTLATSLALTILILYFLILSDHDLGSRYDLHRLLGHLFQQDIPVLLQSFQG